MKAWAKLKNFVKNCRILSQLFNHMLERKSSTKPLKITRLSKIYVKQSKPLKYLNPCNSQIQY